MAAPLAQCSTSTPTFFSSRASSSLLLRKRTTNFTFRFPFSSSALPVSWKKSWTGPVAASVLELGGAHIAKDDIVRDDPKNNVPDSIFAKLGMQLHRRNHHPIGILKNATYECFDANY